ncbi:MAG: hypothetical protein KC464_00650, partial [Myxococcales bacterium]|nr:hypothetical protein [Myxococcales bacterium]
VRDHRTNKEPYLRPGLPHPSMSPVTPVVVSRVMALVRPVVLGCFASIPDEALGDKGTVMTRAVVSIDGAGKLSVEELGPAAGGLDAADPDALATALECVRSGAAGLTTQVDHAAVDHATLAFPIQPAKYRRHK